MAYIVDLLIQTWREEQSSKAIQSLPVKFAESVKELVITMENALSAVASGSLQSAIMKKEIEMLKYLWNDLLKIRRQKLDAAVAGSVPVNEQCLVDFELDYFRALRGVLFKYDAGKNIFPDTRATREISENFMAVRLVQDAAEFVGLDLRTYGPFKTEDVVYMPNEHAEILIAEGKARRVLLPP